MKPRIAVTTVLVICFLTIYSIYSYISTSLKGYLTPVSERNMLETQIDSREYDSEDSETTNYHGQQANVNIPSDALPIKQEVHPQESPQTTDQEGLIENVSVNNTIESQETEGSIPVNLNEDKFSPDQQIPDNGSTQGQAYRPSLPNKPDPTLHNFNNSVNGFSNGPSNSSFSKPDAKVNNLSKNVYRVVINASSFEIADAISESIKTSNLHADPVVFQNGSKYRVYVGSFFAKDKAYELVKRLQSNDYSAYIVMN